MIREDHDFESAREFLEALSPRGPWFGSLPNPSAWIFRGHAHRDWELVPSARRASERAKLHEIARTTAEVRALMNTNIAQALAEVSILRDLELELDRSGLEVPVANPSITIALRLFQQDWKASMSRRNSRPVIASCDNSQSRVPWPARCFGCWKRKASRPQRYFPGTSAQHRQLSRKALACHPFVDHGN